MRAQAGQSTVEYGALLLVALVLFGALAVGASATGVADAVVAHMARALCLVSGRGCDSLALEPCVTASTRRLREGSVRLAFVRLSGSSGALRERRSDGSVVITLSSRAGAGVTANVGGEVALGRLALGGSFGGTVEGSLGHGRVWHLPDDAAADALLRSLEADIARRNPRAAGSQVIGLRAVSHPRRPDETFGDKGLSAKLEAKLGKAGIELGAQDLAGSRADRASGARTLTLNRRNDLSLGIAALGLGAVAKGRHEERHALRVDSGGNPLELITVDVLGFDAGAQLPRPLRAALGTDRVPARSGSLVMHERRLDLRDPANLATARGFIRALRDPGLRGADAVTIAVALRERIEAAGSARTLVYRLRKQEGDVHAEGSLGIGIGGSRESSDEELRLVAARVRDPGGAWRERGDCVA